MNNSKTLLSALALASASLLAPNALAGHIVSVNEQVALVDNQATVQHLLTGGNAGARFSDRYNFTMSSAGDLSALLFPRANNGNSALSIAGFSLYDSSGKFIAGSNTSWLIDVDKLAAGAYYLQVNGTLASNAAMKYLANLSISPQAAPGAAIPEPAPVALMLAGLGLLGVMARRRQSKAKQTV